MFSIATIKIQQFDKIVIGLFLDQLNKYELLEERSAPWN